MEQTERLEVVRECVPLAAVDRALRRIHLELIERGVDPVELGEWLWGAHWFPSLREHPDVLALADALPERLTTGVRCEPQILLQFPHVGPEPEITFHVDQEPEWAGDRRYLRIVGVPLSPWRRDNGGLLIEGGDGPEPVELDPGDVVVMDRDCRHSGGINRTGSIRYGIYFRYLSG